MHQGVLGVVMMLIKRCPGEGGLLYPYAWESLGKQSSEALHIVKAWRSCYVVSCQPPGKGLDLSYTLEGLL